MCVEDEADEDGADGVDCGAAPCFVGAEEGAVIDFEAVIDGAV